MFIVSLVIATRVLICVRVRRGETARRLREFTPASMIRCAVVMKGR